MQVVDIYNLYSDCILLLIDLLRIVVLYLTDFCMMCVV